MDVLGLLATIHFLLARLSKVSSFGYVYSEAERQVTFTVTFR